MAKTFKKGDMELKFYDADDVPKIWDAVAPLFQKSIDRASHGEYDIKTLKALAISGAGVIGCAYDKDELKVAFMAGELFYPTMKAASVYALAGSGYKRMFKELFPLFAEHLRGLGIDAIECSTSPGMTRYYRGTGFEKVYDVLRYDLKGNNHVE